jgi:hypothetical protein
MKQPTTSRYPAFIIGGLLTLPAACFFIISILNFQLGYPYLYDAANPFQQSTSISEPAGFNIYLLILFGPVLALLLNVLAVLDLWLDNGKDRINFQLSVGKNWYNLVMISLSGLTLIIIAAYLFLENLTAGKV